MMMMTIEWTGMIWEVRMRERTLSVSDSESPHLMVEFIVALSIVIRILIRFVFVAVPVLK